MIGIISKAIVEKRAEEVPVASVAKMTPRQLENMVPASQAYERYIVFVPYLLDISLAHAIPPDKEHRQRLGEWFSERMERECQRAVLQAAPKN